MKTTHTDLWTHLHNAGLVHGTPPQQPELTSPWYVKVLLGFSGWLAALFLLGFIGTGFVFIVDNKVAAITTGLVMIGIAFALLRVAKNEFLEHLALAISLAGQALVIYGIFSLSTRHDGIAWLILTLFEIPVLLFIPNFIHRVMTTVIAALGFYMSLNAVGATFVFSGVIIFIVAWIWLNEFTYPRSIRMLQAIGYGLVFALLPLKGSALFGYRSFGWHSTGQHPERWVQPWMGELLIAVVFIYVVWRLLQRYQQSTTSVFTIATLLAALIVSLVSLKAQGITVGIVIMLLGFSASNRILLGLGIIALLFFVSSYYYLLDSTLLVKATTLLSVGVILLGTRWGLSKLVPGVKGAQDA